MACRLHVPSLTVAGFRGIQSLELRDLGRVTLLAGKNGIGKSTILEAIRIFASRGDTRTLIDLIETREEFVPGSDRDGNETLFPDLASLFYEFDPDNDDKSLPVIRIGARPAPHGLSLLLVVADEGREAPPLYSDDVPTKVLRVQVGRRRHTFQVGPKGHFDRIQRRCRPLRVLGSHDSES